MTSINSSRQTRPTGRRRALAGTMTATLLATTLVLTGCGAAGAPTDAATSGSATAVSSPAGNSGTSATSGPSASSAADASADEEPALDLPDPASIEGPSSAETVAEIQPIGNPQAPELPVTVTDHDGQDVTIESTDRILALDLYGTFSDIVTGLGLGDRLVGRTSSDTSSAMAELPLVTSGGHDLNAEAILSLRPTVVLADTTLGPPEVYDQLRSAGITLVMFDPDRSLETNEDMMARIAQALGVPAAGEALIERYDAEMETAQARIDALVPDDEADLVSAAILYVRGTAGIFFVMGSDSGGDVVESVGALNSAEQAGITGTKPANAEALAALNPDVILVMADGLESTGGLAGLLERPGVAQTAAGQKQRVVDVPDGQLMSYGPQTPQALVALAEAVYNPEGAQ
ncbi:hemin ABC transporter substrate-binding protein [Citricoccus sp. K5]|uniref:heme/hemin ABC transporter substrate-binding protein n=1 Tax=Citricoccus sp. K5 TaxID=2653135 RepID=UPI0012EF04BA|nr:ABC transporter substrate-binding protein [Citricoccus sp. K5]VXC04875.1 Heme ABC transporter, cell surface heme and hemoprotein receptor HmuT [Citricoccus sp. K5]